MRATTALPVVLAIAAAIAPPLAAHAARRPVRLEIQIEGKLPFGKRDLAELLRLRLPLVPDQVGVVKARLRPQGDGSVLIEVAGRIRQAHLQPGGDPLAGARLIALLLLDLIVDQVGTDDEPMPAPPLASASAPPAPPRPWRKSLGASRDPRGSIAVMASMSVGALTETTYPLGPGNRALPQVGFEPMIDLRLRLTSWLRLFGQAGFNWTPAGPFNFGEAVFRLGVAPVVSFFDFPVGLVARPFWISAPSESFADNHTLIGATLGARVIATYGETGYLFAAVGLDVMFNREVYQAWGGDYAFINTGWAVGWLGLGIGFGQ